jgi:hypothetical protein
MNLLDLFLAYETLKKYLDFNPKILKVKLKNQFISNQ